MKNTLFLISISREKLYAIQWRREEWTLSNGNWTMKKVVQNPIAEAVIKQCPNLSDKFEAIEAFISDTNRLSGDDILRILCEQQCEEQIDSGRNIVVNFWTNM